jgi:hypothetical protein
LRQRADDGALGADAGVAAQHVGGLGDHRVRHEQATYAHLWPAAEERTRRAAESIKSASLGEPGAPLAESAASAGE